MQAALLPNDLDWARYERLRHDPSVWRPAIDHIAALHALTGPCARYDTGTAIVFSVGKWVIKLFPPLFADDAPKEMLALRAIEGRLGIPTPTLHAHGKLEGYAYVVMRRLDGTPLDVLWPRLDRERRLALAHALGTMVRALHGIEVGESSDFSIDWPAFRREMRARAPEHHAQGLDPLWADELARAWPWLDDEPERVTNLTLLHTELGPGHVLSDGIRLTGLIDLAEAMVGDPEYDLAVVGLLITQGDAQAFSAFLDGYGLAQSERGPALERRLLRHALLHRYGKLSWYLTRVPPPGKTLADAAHFWFGHDRSA